MAAPKKYLDETGLIYLITKIAATFYQKPNAGIPEEDLSWAVREAIANSSHYDPATDVDAGLMSAEDKKKLDAINIQYNTTAYWNNRLGYIPPAGAIIIYSDYKVVEQNGRTYYQAGMKIGSGNAYVQDLAFISNDSAADLLIHKADTVAHVTPADRSRWDNKINVNDASEVVGEALIFNRN